MEIDLLRIGDPLPFYGAPQSDYRIMVSRSQTRPQAALYPFNLPDPIPNFPIPLLEGIEEGEEPVLPLNQLLHNLYDLGGFDLGLNYSHPPIPPLNPEQQQWANSIINVQ